MSDRAVQPEEPQRCGSSLIGRTDFGMEIIDLCFSSIAGHFTDLFYRVKAWKKKHPRVDAEVLLLPTWSPNGGDF